jgi:hypothetical protein
MWFLQMTLETMRELFGIIDIGEEEVPNAKHMGIGKEEVPMSQRISDVVLPEEEEVPVPQGPTVMIMMEDGEAMRTRDLYVVIDDEGPIPPLVSSSTFFFFYKTQEILLILPFFSQKCGRFVG